MKNFVFFIFVCFLCFSFSTTVIAKEKPMDLNDVSVQHLKKIVDEANQLRKNDIPFEQVDVSADVSLTEEAKEKFYKDYKIFEIYKRK